jgi:hypothetical protein
MIKLLLAFAWCFPPEVTLRQLVLEPNVTNNGPESFESCGFNKAIADRMLEIVGYRQ